MTNVNQVTKSEADQQAAWLNEENIDGGVKKGPYNQDKPDATSGIGPWLVDTEHEIGISCQLVKERREQHGDEVAAQMCRDEYEPKD